MTPRSQHVTSGDLRITVQKSGWCLMGKLNFVISCLQGQGMAEGLFVQGPVFVQVLRDRLEGKKIPAHIGSHGEGADESIP